MKFRIPLYRPALTGNERKYIDDCIDTGWISSKGKYVGMLEEKFAEYIGVKYASTACTGTAALHLALSSYGIGKGDEVIVPSFTYIAPISAISYTGANPVFADILESTWQINPDEIKKKITKKTKAILVVHAYSHPCEMSEINNIAKNNGLIVIEDAAEALGSTYEGKKAGGLADTGIFSFFGNKILTSGEGGILVTNDKNIYEKSFHFKTHGVSPEKDYWHDVIGFNYKMNNLSAAVGLAQLEYLDERLKSARRIYESYKLNLASLPMVMLPEAKNVYNSCWMFTALTESNNVRDELRKYLRDEFIETRPAFYPIHTMPMFESMGFKLPVSEKTGLCGISLPSYTLLSNNEVKEICDLIKEFYKNR